MITDNCIYLLQDRYVRGGVIVGQLPVGCALDIREFFLVLEYYSLCGLQGAGRESFVYVPHH